MTDRDLSLPENGPTLIIRTNKTLLRQGLDGVASRRGTGSAAIREHSGRPSAKQDAELGLKCQTYFVHAPGAGRVKIGKSACVRKRFAELSCSSPEWLVLLGVLDGDREAEMHLRFHRYRVKGEWFDLAGGLRDFLWSEFPDKQPAVESVRYIRDHTAHIGGVPGRVTLDYVFGAASSCEPSGSPENHSPPSSIDRRDGETVRGVERRGASE